MKQRIAQQWRMFVAAIVSAALCACGGGGGSTVTPAAAGAPATASTAAVTFTLTIPSTAAAQQARSIAEISAGTQSFVLALTSVNGVATTTSVTTNITSPACVAGSGGTTCSVQIAAPGGNDVFTVTLFAGLGATGAVLGTASVPQAISANGVNAIAITVNGTIASIQLVVTPGLFTLGTPATASVSLVAKDASGAQILVPGNYTNPITLTSSDTGGHVKLSLNGGAVATSVQSTTPSDTVRVIYDGGGTPQAPTIAATATGIAGTSESLVVDSALTLTPSSVTFTQLGASGTQTVAIAGGLAPYNISGNSPPLAVSVSGSTITLTANGALSETLTVSDALGTSTTLPVTATTVTVPIQ